MMAAGGAWLWRRARGCLLVGFWLLVLMLASVPAVADDVAVKIGNPLLAKFPVGGDARPRSIWDLQVFNGKLYLAHGDYWNNAGPIDVWTYRGDGANFVKEYTTQEEMIWDFFVQDDLLFIPGVDSVEESPIRANIYVQDPQNGPGGGWTRRATLTGGVHSYDVALFQNRLFTSMTMENQQARTLVSTDMGASWSVLLQQYSAPIPFADFLFLQGPTNYVYDGSQLTAVTPQLHVSQLSMARRVRVGDGLLYAYPVRYLLTPTPLYYITAAQIQASGAATQLAAFAGTCVRDILARNGLCYVMTAETNTTSTFRGRIYASADLTHWWQASEFTVPGVPLSFELYRNRFYVGLGSLFTGNWDKLVGPEAGSIWRIQPAAVEMAWVPAKEGVGGSMTVLGAAGLTLTVEATSSLQDPQWEVIGTVQSASGIADLVDPDAAAHEARYYRVILE
ncbi:MAG TPA: hypothetical protein PLT37_10085 [Kiritimatiellia bacterium]|nr:hypothetical protein [Kiritimatiellia bacterium]HQF21578.1 hypothetical protein [Kiritimatiellia bacterium]HQG75640.1 hypothetical protein [Kiritimatiellia bacterium]